MNRQKQQRTVGEWTALPYIPPQCRIVPFENEGFICATIEHRASLSTEEEWEEDEEFRSEDQESGFLSRIDW